MIRFHHCDPAGIVFYPQYLVLCNELVEDWLAEALGVPLDVLIHTHKLGMPMRHLEAEFLRASRQGDELEFSLGVLNVGTTSLTFRIQAGKDDAPRFISTQTIVWSDVTGPSAVRIDDDWRQRFSAFMQTDTTPSTP